MASGFQTFVSAQMCTPVLKQRPHASKLQGSTETFNVIYDDFSKNTSNTSWYSFAVTHIAAHNILGGGVYYVEGFKTNERYEWQKATSYESTSIRQFARSKVNGAWNEWVRII